MRPLHAIAIILGLLTPLAPAAADTIRAGDMVIEGQWARATPPTARNGAAYLVLRNEGTEPDRLVAATTAASERVELHTHIREGDIIRMREVDAIDLPAGETVTLEPGGLHVMLLGLRAPLVDGEQFTLALELERAGTIEIEVPVKPAGHRADGHGHGHGHGHGREQRRWQRSRRTGGAGRGARPRPRQRPLQRRARGTPRTVRPCGQRHRAARHGSAGDPVRDAHASR